MSSVNLQYLNWLACQWTSFVDRLHSTELKGLLSDKSRLIWISVCTHSFPKPCPYRGVFPVEDDLRDALCRLQQRVVAPLIAVDGHYSILIHAIKKKTANSLEYINNINIIVCIDKINHKTSRKVTFSRRSPHLSGICEHQGPAETAWSP